MEPWLQRREEIPRRREGDEGTGRDSRRAVVVRRECVRGSANDILERDLRTNCIDGGGRCVIRSRMKDGGLEFRERRCARIRHPSRGCEGA